MWHNSWTCSMRSLLLIYTLTKSLVAVRLTLNEQGSSFSTHVSPSSCLWVKCIYTNSHFECTEIDSYLVITGGLWGHHCDYCEEDFTLTQQVCVNLYSYVVLLLVEDTSRYDSLVSAVFPSRTSVHLQILLISHTWNYKFLLICLFT